MRRGSTTLLIQNLNCFDDGSMRFWMEKEHYEFPSRQSRPVFHKFGNLFVTSYKTLVEEGKLEGDKNYAIEIPPVFSMDINTHDDLEAIERVIEKFKSKN